MSSTIVKRSPSKNLIAGILGNILENYDTALYALLVPFIAPLFFTDLPYLTELIVGYGIQAIGILTRPLGALFFGSIGDRYGRKPALYFTMLGMTIATVLMGCSPTFAQVGSSAPLLVLLLRGVQSFFAGGETKGGVIFVLEHGKKTWRGFLSSLFDSSSVLGILFASGLVALLASLNLVETYWRWLFWLGGLGGILGIIIRFVSDETIDFQLEKKSPSRFLTTLRNNRRAIVLIVLATGFSYVTYTIPFILMNGFLPLISSISKAEAVEINTLLLFFDMLLLPLFGFLTRWIPIIRIMKIAALSLAILAVPLFWLLQYAPMSSAIIVRTVIVIFGVAFAAPLHQWSINLTAVKDRFVVTSFATAIGSQLIGIPCAAVSLWLYEESGWIIAPAFYLLFSALGAVFALWRGEKN